MKTSLSILLPVYNKQATLAAEALQYLEIASDLQAPFEIIVVDDGSTDATREVAEELAVKYPQIGVCGHRVPCGTTATLRTALARARGDFLFVRDAECKIPLSEISRMWRLATDYDLILGQPNLPTQEGALAVPGLRLIARHVADDVLQWLEDSTQLAQHVAQAEIRWIEVRLGHGEIHRLDALEKKASAIARQILEGPRRRPVLDAPKSPKSGVTAPKFVRVPGTSSRSAEGPFV